MHELRISIPGDPVGKGRPRVTRRGVFTPEKTARWEAGAAQLIRLEWNGREPLDQPVGLVVRAVARRPKRLLRRSDPGHRLWRTTKPDIDNVLKIAADALVKAGVIVDDTRVVVCRGESLFCSLSEGPCVEIDLWLQGDR